MLESRILVWHQPSAPPRLHTSTAAAWTAATLVASYGSPIDFIMSCHPIYNNLSKSVGPCAVYGSVCQRINTHKTTMVWSRYLLVQHTNGGERNNCRSFTSLRFNLKVQVEYVVRERKKNCYKLYVIKAIKPSFERWQCPFPPSGWFSTRKVAHE